MVSNPAPPGYTCLINRGYPTLGEGLSVGFSKNHRFLGEVGSSFIHALVGIQQMLDSIGYRKLLIKSAVSDVTSCWTENDGNKLQFSVVIPANTTTEIWVSTLGWEYRVVTGVPVFEPSSRAPPGQQCTLRGIGSQPAPPFSSD